MKKKPNIFSAVETATFFTAYAGGFVMLGLIVMSSLSVVGRSLIGAGLDSVPGDFELMEMGMAFVIFCFLPYCELKRGHMTVDLFKTIFSPVMNQTIDIASHFLMIVVSTFVLWRLWLGMEDKFNYYESSFILYIPYGWSYALCLPPVFLWILTSICMTVKLVWFQNPSLHDSSRHLSV